MSQVGLIGLRSVVRDGGRLLKMKCPRCGQWGDIDADQFHGRVSIQCPNAPCDFHETVNMAPANVSVS